MGIYLILNVSGQTDRLLARAPQIKYTHFRIFFNYFYEFICMSLLPIVDKFLRSPGKKCWKMTEFQVPHKVAQITLMHAPKCYQNKHDTDTIPVYLYKGELYLLYILIYCKYKRD